LFVKKAAMGLLETLVPKAPPLHLDADGVMRVGGTRVTLDTVVGAYEEGATIEDILVFAECSREGEWEGQVLFLPLWRAVQGIKHKEAFSNATSTTVSRRPPLSSEEAVWVASLLRACKAVERTVSTEPANARPSGPQEGEPFLFLSATARDNID
jgi:hypothetical protein